MTLTSLSKLNLFGIWGCDATCVYRGGYIFVEQTELAQVASLFGWSESAAQTWMKREAKVSDTPTQLPHHVLFDLSQTQCRALTPVFVQRLWLRVTDARGRLFGMDQSQSEHRVRVAKVGDVLPPSIPNMGIAHTQMQMKNHAEIEDWSNQQDNLHYQYLSGLENTDTDALTDVDYMSVV